MERHPQLPDFVPVEVPHDKASAERIQAGIRRRLCDWMQKYGPLPQREAVNVSVHSERRRSHDGDLYLEQYVTYNGDDGEDIPAYLLIPEERAFPSPAIVANHQCSVDCDLGKDAVVGKSYDRADQAYGFEMMLKGFIVLAPDSINCGERAIAGLKGPECDQSKCMQAAFPFLSVDSIYLKHISDAMRAVDVLQSMDTVDSDRIGMIGHSLGAGTTFWTAASDDRVRASVLSCQFLGGIGGSPWYQAYGSDQGGIYYHELLALIAPRSVLATRGEEDPVKFGLDSGETERSVMAWAFDYARLFSALLGGSESAMQCRLFDGGHEFPKANRNEAYDWIMQQLT